MKKSSLIPYFILLSILLAFSCKKEKDEVNNNNNTSQISFTACKNEIKGLDSNQTCIKITAFNPNQLAVEHINTEFCCGTSEMQIDYSVGEDTIIIKEIDLGPYTYCFCQHDLSYVIKPLNNHHYHIIVIESENSYERDTIIGEFDYSPNLYKEICK